MRISIFVTFVVLFILPLISYGQGDGTESLQADNNINKDGELDGKSDDANGDNENKEEAKPRKTTFKEERFEKLFNNRNRKPRLPAPKYHQKPKPKLPSFIKNPPSIKPLGQDGLPIDEAPKSTTPSPRAKQNNSRANVVKATTNAPSSRTRSRASTTTTTQRPSVNESNKRFNSSPRSRTSTSTLGRGRIN